LLDGIPTDLSEKIPKDMPKKEIYTNIKKYARENTKKYARILQKICQIKYQFLNNKIYKYHNKNNSK
jgi:hypothetical protein